MRRIVVTFFVGAVLVAFVACGDIYVDPDGTAIAPALNSVDGSSVFPEAIAVRCPSTRPRENSSCAGPGSVCEYGSSPDRQCNEVFACAGARPDTYWEARPSDVCTSKLCVGGSDTASLDGKPCELDAGATVTDEVVCNMTDGVCACTTGRDGTRAHPRRWACVHPTPGCPARRPLAGQACLGGSGCDYGSCEFKRGVLMECNNGVWASGGASCK